MNEIINQNRTRSFYRPFQVTHGSNALQLFDNIELPRPRFCKIIFVSIPDPISTKRQYFQEHSNEEVEKTHLVNSSIYLS